MSTALELGPKGWRQYIETASLRRPTKSGLTHAEKEKRKQILKKVIKAADALKARFGTRRIILFGSLAHEAWFTQRTDVDLAVEGLSGDDYWQAWKLAEEVISDLPVELIDLDIASESLRSAIQRTGIEL